MKNKVEEQYTKWVYPLPIEDMKIAILEGSIWEIGDPLLYWPLFWPKKRGVEDKLDILCAGCGTNQAAYYASRNSNWNVVGIDLSESSLAHQEKLKKKHNLRNLTLKKLNLTQINSLELSFDFITSTGVLHHMPDPDVGLKSLAGVLRPEGIMNLMVYGKSLRLGIYVLQEAFRLMGLQQIKHDVDLIKNIIQTLPNDHVVKRYVNTANDLQYDAGIVDTFLHPQDQAYWVKDIYSFTRRAGLEFLSWCDPVEYSLEAHVPLAHPAWEKLKNLSSEDAAHVCDLLAQGRGTHRWAAAHPVYVKNNHIPIDDDGLFDCTIALHRTTKVIQPANYSMKINAKCERGNQKYEIPYQLAELIIKMLGVKSINESILELNLKPLEKNEFLIKIRNAIKKLYGLGHIYILLPESR